jgi:hypothetical protein
VGKGGYLYTKSNMITKKKRVTKETEKQKVEWRMIILDANTDK